MRRVSCVSFNQDGSRLAVGFDADDGDDGTGSSGGSSFCVFSCEPVSLESTMATTSTVTSAALLYKTRVSAVVLASQPNVVALHDGGGKGSSLLGELSFPNSTKVRAVALRRDAVAVALSDGRAAAYSLDSLRLLRSVETGANELGLLALAAGGNRTIFACPWGGAEEGEGGREEEAKGGGLFGGRGGGFLLRGKRSSSKAPRRSGTGTVRVEFVDAGRSLLVRAARHAVAAIALSREGSLLATASERGTLVRVFSLEGGGGEHVTEGGGSGAALSSSSSSSSPALTPCLRELRRGGEPARMLSLAFSPSVASFPSSSSSSSSSSAAEEEKRQQQQQQQQQRLPRWIAAASDKGTVHVWSLSRPPSSKTTTTATTTTTAAASRQLLAAAAAAAGAPSPASLAAERSAFHFKLPGFDEKKRHHEEVEPALAALSFSPGGKAVFAASATVSSGRGGGSCCGLVAVALPEDQGEEEGHEGATSSSSAAAAELFCVPDLFALLPR